MINSNKNYYNGIALGVFAYIVWGVLPIYFKSIGHVSPVEILSHRIIWSLLFLVLIIIVTRDFESCFNALKKWRLLLLSSLLIASNWLIYIFAVTTNNIVEASLGYFISPLIYLLLGLYFLKEKLNKLQWISILIGGAGIAIELIEYGRIPWLALLLAISFGFYGLVRKKLNVSSVSGLAIETALLTPFAILCLCWLHFQQQLTFLNTDFTTNILLLCSGLLTSIPLICFVAAIVRLPLSTISILEYLTPSLSLIIGVLVYGEVFANSQWLSFGFIWLGLLLFTVDGFNNHKRELTKVPSIVGE